MVIDTIMILKLLFKLFKMLIKNNIKKWEAIISFFQIQHKQFMFQVNWFHLCEKVHRALPRIRHSPRGWKQRKLNTFGNR